jgi:hypothetical protein
MTFSTIALIAAIATLGYSYPQKSDSKLNKFFYTKFAVYDKEKINISI